MVIIGCARGSVNNRRNGIFILWLLSHFAVCNAYYWRVRMSSVQNASQTEVTRDWVYEMDRKHVFHSWSAQAHISPLPIAGAKGSYFWDYDGNKYLDFSSQLVNVNLGHQHPKMIEAIQKQAADLVYIGPGFAHADRSVAAQLIAGVAPEGMNKVFFTNGGADANEHAVRMARHHTGRMKVLSAYRSYHGATGGAITLTGEPRRWAVEPTAAAATVHFWGHMLIVRPSMLKTKPKKASGRLSICVTPSWLRGLTVSPPLLWKRSWERMAFWCHHRGILLACGPCAMSSAL